MHCCGAGEFGIVYKAHIVKDPGTVVTDVVAIKTLKGITGNVYIYIQLWKMQITIMYVMFNRLL